MSAEETTVSKATEADAPTLAAAESPFLRAPEGARTVFLVTLAATCGPLAAGIFLFGWRAAAVSALAIGGCVLIEGVFYRVTRVPALFGRSHAWLTGMLLALTLPPFVPWYIPLIAAAFAIIVGKVIFGGVGHFLWQPALVGRLAVMVMFPAILAHPFAPFPGAWPILAQNKVLIGDVLEARPMENYRRWRNTPAPEGADAIALLPPSALLAKLTHGEPAYSALAYVPAEMDRAKPAVLLKLPPISDLFYGARPGGIGETCIIIIVVSGLYLIYRNYVKVQLPLAFIASAWCVLAVAPVQLAGANDTTRLVWWPLLAEGLDVGFTYVNYQLFSGELILAAFFLATEMTSRPVTTGGQVLFGIGCGASAMLIRLYLNVPIPCYMAVLAMNTLTPAIDAIWRPRVLGQKRFAFLRRRR